MECPERTAFFSFSSFIFFQMKFHCRRYVSTERFCFVKAFFQWKDYSVGKRLTGASLQDLLISKMLGA